MAMQGSYFKTIGETLSICEAGSYLVGIPWLPPTSYVNKIAKQFYLPLADFVKINLVGVPTSQIERYCEDLEQSIQNNNHQNTEFYLYSPTTFEKLTFCLIFTGIFFSADLLICLILFGTISTSLVYACITGLIVFGFCLAISREENRYKSFLSLLQKELMRRKGFDLTNSNKILISKPISFK
jgi:hypothetical protein